VTARRVLGHRLRALTVQQVQGCLIAELPTHVQSLTCTLEKLSKPLQPAHRRIFSSYGGRSQSIGGQPLIMPGAISVVSDEANRLKGLMLLHACEEFLLL
jgi:hypothetical protein